MDKSAAYKNVCTVLITHHFTRDSRVSFQRTIQKGNFHTLKEYCHVEKKMSR